MMRSLPLFFSAAALLLSGAALTVTLLKSKDGDPSLILGAGDPLGAQVRPKVMFPALEDPEGRHVNHAVALAHNWGWQPENGWSRDDTGQPSVAVVLESWYRGLGELNFDMRPPAGYTSWRGGRAMGLAARYDGSFTILSIGGEQYSPGGTGAQIVGGTTTTPIMTLFEAESGEAEALRVQRRDSTASVSLRGGAEPALALGDVSLRRAERGRLAVEGELAVSSLRIGSGASVQALHVLTVEVQPDSVPAQGEDDMSVTAAGLRAASLVFVSGPDQPRGISLAGARAGGDDRLVLRFVNSSRQPMRPAAGTYTILAVETAAP